MAFRFHVEGEEHPSWPHGYGMAAGSSSEQARAIVARHVASNLLRRAMGDPGGNPHRALEWCHARIRAGLDRVLSELEPGSVMELKSEADAFLWFSGRYYPDPLEAILVWRQAFPPGRDRRLDAIRVMPTKEDHEHRLRLVALYEVGILARLPCLRWFGNEIFEPSPADLLRSEISGDVEVPPHPAEPPAALAPGDLVSLSDAAKALGIRESDARRWIREAGLIRKVAGRDRVLWGDVLDRIRSGGGPEASPPADAPRPRRRGRLPRARLD